MLNQKGFSIIEVTVALVIMGFISAGIASTMVNQANGIYYMEDQLAHQDLKMAMNSLLRDDKICTDMLSAVNVPSALGSITSSPAGSIVIKDAKNVLVYDPSDNAKNKFDNLKISNIRVENVDVVDDANGNRVNLLIDVNRTRGIDSQALKSISIPKNVTINGSRLITKCSGLGDDLEENLTLVTTVNFIGSGKSGAVSSYTMPPNIKAFSLTTEGGTCNWETGTPPNNDQHTTFISGINVSALLNGKHKNNGQPIVAGKTLTFSGGKYRYNGILIATMSGCTSFPTQPAVTWTNHPFNGRGPARTNFDYPPPVAPVLENLRLYE